MSSSVNYGNSNTTYLNRVQSYAAALVGSGIWLVTYDGLWLVIDGYCRAWGNHLRDWLTSVF